MRVILEIRLSDQGKPIISTQRGGGFANRYVLAVLSFEDMWLVKYTPSTAMHYKTATRVNTLEVCKSTP